MDNVATRINRGIECLVMVAVLQMLPKASKYLLNSLLVKGNVGELPIEKHVWPPPSIPGNDLPPKHRKLGN